MLMERFAKQSEVIGAIFSLWDPDRAILWSTSPDSTSSQGASEQEQRQQAEHQAEQQEEQQQEKKQQQQ